MSLKKNTERGLCPFNKFKECNPKCVLYRKGMRYLDDGKDPIPFEDCAFNISADAAENQVGRTFAMQQEMGEIKNAVLFQAVAGLTGSSEAKEMLARMVQNAGGLNKLIGGSDAKA